MRKGKERKTMTSQWVIPRWSKASDDAPVIFQQAAHYSQHRQRLRKMFKGVKADNDIDLFMDFSRKAHAIRDACVFRPLPRFGQRVFTYIKAGNFRVGMLGNLDGLSAGRTAKVHDRLIRQFIPDVWPEQ